MKLIEKAENAGQKYIQCDLWSSENAEMTTNALLSCIQGIKELFFILLKLCP